MQDHQSPPPESRASHILLVLFVGGWLLLILAPAALVPFLGEQHPGIRLLYGFFSPVCHQVGERSLHLFGSPLGVCARCTGIYAGFLLGILAAPRLMRRWRPQGWKVWAVAAAPMVLDVASSLVGIHERTHLTRVVTGLAFGGVAGAVLGPILALSLQRFVRRRKSTQGVPHESQA